MPTATVRDLLSASLTEIGVLAAGEVMTAADSSLGLAALNRWIDAQAADRLQMYEETRTVWTIVSGDENYTVGTGGDVNRARPVYVSRVQFQDTNLTPTTEFPLSTLTDDSYAAITMKDQESTYPQCYWYNPTFPLATLIFWPVPTSGTLEGVMYAPTAVAEFANLSTSVSLPPGYQQMIVKCMAVELAPSYEVQPNPLLLKQAQDSLITVQRANKRLSDLSLDQGAVIQGGSRWGGWSIYTGP